MTAETLTVAEVPVVEVTTPKVNMSKLIIAAFKANKKLDTPANEIVAAVKQNDGVEVTVSLVNNIRKRLKDSRKAKVARTTAPTPETPVSELDRMMEVKTFAESVGGLEALKNFITKIEVFATVKV